MCKVKDELRIQSQREAHIDTVKQYMGNHCDRRGTMRGSENLTDTEKKGMKQLQESIDSKGWLLDLEV